MARDRDNRSPSPAGSHARRRRDDGHSRRDDHRERRDDRRDDRRDRDRRDDRRRRSRSRSPERRRDHRDREYRRRERSVERYDDRQADSYHPRRRSRERGDRRRDSRDDRRRDGSADSRKRRDRSRSRPRDNEPKAQSAEEQQAARQAKLKAWKQKVAAEQALKEAELQAAGGPKSILIEIDKKEGLSPATSSPQSPADASPVPYGGKFDPKAIAKKAHASATTSSVLGGDVATPLPKLASSSIPTPAPSRKSATTAKSANHQEPRGPVSGFGLGAKVADEKTKSAVFEEEQSTKRKLERLPTPPLGEVNGDPESEEDVEMQADEDMLADEDTLAAERAAAETRQEARSSVERVDTVMVEAEEEVEEADPLDAFMSGLTATPLKGKPRQAPQALFDDEDNGLTAMEANPEDILAMANKKKKKDLPTVNHAKVKYEPFRKTFFSQPVDMADWTEADVANLRLELDGIKVRGLDVPKPVQRWAQCGLGVQSLDVIQRLGYSAPTSIQAQAIPAITSGRDVIGVAKTGSGKTIAFLLPMFRHIKDQRALDMLEGPIGLIMTPTRELATQIHKDCKPFLKALNLRAVCAYGGAPIKDQIADLKRGAEIIVCTPGRMIDLLAANSGRVTNLRRVTYMVLDEADRMFDMGFEPQVMKILANIRPDRQTVLFSATFPRQMEALARKTLSKPVEIIVGGRSVVAPEITQVVEVRNEDQKFIRLLELLGNMYEDDKNEDDRALIFVDRQESADALLRELMRKGYPCMSIHGGKDQIDRDSTIDDFKAGVVPILVATSVAARGLDVKQLKLVVNYDAPNHLEDYVHRAGRTGRAGNTGTAVTFLTDEQDRYAVDIAKALKQSGQPVPEEVQKLVEVFNEKVKAGKEKALAGGFGGKGLERLDQERDATKARERKTFKTGDEGEDEEKDKETGDDLFAKAASGIKPLDSQSEFIPGVPKGIDLDGKITVHRTEKDGPQNQMDKVAAAVQNIAAKLSKAGVMRQGVPIDNKGPDAGAFHATLEINDFPQKARWAVTNRTNVAKILESTGTSITTKGSFYAAGKDPGPTGDPKLYILVEGDTEVVVHDAMRELMRLLKEGTIAAAEGEPSRGAPGRYTVV